MSPASPPYRSHGTRSARPDSSKICRCDGKAAMRPATDTTAKRRQPAPSLPDRKQTRRTRWASCQTASSRECSTGSRNSHRYSRPDIPPPFTGATQTSHQICVSLPQPALRSSHLPTDSFTFGRRIGPPRFQSIRPEGLPVDDSSERHIRRPESRWVKRDTAYQAGLGVRPGTINSRCGTAGRDRLKQALEQRSGALKLLVEAEWDRFVSVKAANESE